MFCIWVGSDAATANRETFWSNCPRSLWENVTQCNAFFAEKVLIKIKKISLSKQRLVTLQISS